MSLLTELDAYYLDHRRCGELEAGVEGPIVWIACPCGPAWRGGWTRPTHSRSTVDPPYRPDIDRRRFLPTSVAGALAAPLSGDAQETTGVHHIGVLSATTPEWLAPLLEVFQAELNRRGFPPDRIVIQYGMRVDGTSSCANSRTSSSACLSILL